MQLKAVWICSGMNLRSKGADHSDRDWNMADEPTTKENT
jgi:hypothetical protein